MNLEITGHDYSTIKVFLGGTCNNDNWRDEFVKGLKMPYFNPVVSDRTEEAKEREDKEKLECAYSVYAITDNMKGLYSIAELIDSVHRNTYGTIFINLTREIDEERARSLKDVESLVEERGSKVFHTLEDARNFLNEEWNILRM